MCVLIASIYLAVISLIPPMRASIYICVYGMLRVILCLLGTSKYILTFCTSLSYRAPCIFVLPVGFWGVVDTDLVAARCNCG